MRTTFPGSARFACLLVAVALAGCGKKKESGDTAASGSAPEPVEPAPVTCPAGNAVQEGKCVPVVTAEKVEAVAKQQSRLDDLANTLGQIDKLAAPIELLDAFRKLDQWKAMTDKFDRLEAVDAAIGDLDTAVKTLRTFKGSLGEASGRLGNLKGELDRLMTETGKARQLEEVRGQVSTQLRTTMQPLADQVATTLDKAIQPLSSQLEQAGDVLDLVCASLKLSGGGDDAKTLCKQAKSAFADGVAYFASIKTQPAKLFTEVQGELEAQLPDLIDAETKKALDAAQAKVNDALKLPAAAAGAGSGSARRP